MECCVCHNSLPIHHGKQIDNDCEEVWKLLQDNLPSEVLESLRRQEKVCTNCFSLFQTLCGHYDVIKKIQEAIQQVIGHIKFRLPEGRGVETVGNIPPKSFDEREKYQSRSESELPFVDIKEEPIESNDDDGVESSDFYDSELRESSRRDSGDELQVFQKDCEDGNIELSDSEYSMELDDTTIDSMASTYTKFRSTSSTFKLSHCGYVYNRRNGYNNKTYWYCDQKQMCSASLIEKNGKFTKGRPSAWNNKGLHKTYPSNLHRTEAQVQVGEARNIIMKNPTLTAAEVLERTVSRLDKHAQIHTPRDKDMKRSLYRYRKSGFGQPKTATDNPTNEQEVHASSSDTI